MTSSMLSGERRWASSTRRGGMTVLGKVVVPKPINLPSQRSENHGLDPNVEIVPKGTLSWGSKSSSAWGSSILSPNTDGGASSPSHLSGRPSSGSGTRPSTASSDRAYESTSNASGPNSRPASASGALTSNQTSLISLRPRSAETRPGSSQLSRFAEHSEHPVAWSSAGTAEKLGVAPPKNDGFSLTSGDFPTLGSGKESSGKNGLSSHSRPSSSSGGVGTEKETIEAPASGDMSASENLKNGTVNSWKRDDPSYCEDGGRPGMEKWQGNPQTYPAPPQHYDAWHGTPMSNPQSGVWFRGPAPYGNPVAPAGFPMEPYPYYRPQIPATGIPNPQPVPPPGAGARGPHPKNGDMYRPHMPDAYVRPGMPIRPGFYPGPVAYEGYYGPPMGYCSSNEREVSFMGMAAGPAVYNRYSGQGPEPGNSHGRYANNQSQIGEQLESGQPQDNRGPYKVLLKQHDGWDRRNEEHKREGAVTNNSLRGDQPRISSWENDWKSDCKKDGESNTGKVPSDEASFETFDDHGPSVPAKVQSPEGGGNVKAIDDISEKKLKSDSYGWSKASQPHATAPTDSSLIQKIEGLNAKVRASDGRSETMTVSSGENQRNKFQANAKANQNTNEAGHGPSYSERTRTTEITHPIPHEAGISRGDKNFDSTAGTRTNISRRSTHGMQSRGDHYGRGRFKTQEFEGWQKKPSIPEPTAVVSAVHSETSILHLHDHHGSTEATDNLGSHSHGKLEGQSVSPMFEQSDDHAQRAKIKELAKQRTRQLQEEEEERIKKQMAKARAKLEELNRRTQAVEGSTEKLENASTGAVQAKQEESQTSSESSIGARRYGPPKSALGSKSNVVAQANESYSSGVEKPCLPSRQVPSEAPKSATGEPLMMQAQSAPLQQGVNGANTAHNNAPQVHESNISKQKRSGFKQKQSPNMTEVSRTHTDVEDNATASVGVVANEVHLSGGSTLPVNSNAGADTSLHPRRKSKNTKNRHKTEDLSALSSVGSKESIANVSQESGHPKAPEHQLDPTVAVQMQNIPRGADRSSEQHPSSPNEDFHDGVNSQWKPQQSRRMPRNSLNSRTAEKFYSSDTAVWAPVRSHNKAEATDEASPKNAVDGVGPSVKSDNQVQINPKNKRAEMERYVPKPVAKEMAQQGGSNHQPVASVINQATTDDSIPRAGIGSQGNESSNNVGMVLGKAGFSVESRSGNNRHNKQGKVHGSWRQRGSTELTSTQGFQDGASYASNVNQNVQKSNELPHSQKADVSLMKEQENYSKEQENFNDEWNADEWNATDDWGVSHNLNSVEPVSVPIVKDQGVTSRGKRHAFKGHKGMANNRDVDQKRSSGDTNRSYTQSSTSETSQVDLFASSKENRGVVERPTSHWQPKSQALSANNYRGNRNNCGQNVGAEANRAESIRLDGVLPQPKHLKDISESSGQHVHDQSISERNNGMEEPIHRHQESRGDRETASLKGHSHLPNQGPIDPVEIAPVNLETRQDQRSLSGPRRSGSQNNRYSRSQESRGDWNYSGQDSKQHNPHPSRERARQNSHYEYQPVGSYNNKSNSEGPKDSVDSAGARPQGRGQNHSRRGGGSFYGRQSGVREDAGYD